MKRHLLLGTIAAVATALAACSAGPPATPTTDAGSPAAAPALDAAFGEAGVLAAPQSTTAHDRFISVVEGADGLIYASGFVRTGTDTAASVTRFRDGALDTGYGTNGTVVVNVAPNATAVEVARGLVVQEDGSVVLASPFEKDPAAAGDAAKDTDIAVIRLDADGALEPAFGEGGIARVDLGAGRAVDPETYLADNSWGLAARDGGYVVFGTTPGRAADRTDADFALAGLTTTGAPDTGFGDGGVLVVDLEGSGDSARNVLVADDGSILATGYSRGADEVVRPVLIKTDGAGVLDPAFGQGGVASHTVLPGVAESYQVAQQGDAYVMAGYGRGADSAEKVDLVAYRFTAAGELDTSFGSDGVFRLDLAGQDDRARNLTILPDGRIMVVGSGKTTADAIDGLVVVLDADGALDTAFGDGGHLLVDLGQTADGIFGVTVSADGSAAWLAGFSGGTPDTDEHDDSVLLRMSL